MAMSDLQVLEEEHERCEQCPDPQRLAKDGGPLLQLDHAPLERFHHVPVRKELKQHVRGLAQRRGHAIQRLLHAGVASTHGHTI